MLINHVYEGELTEVETDPRLLELAMRHHKALVSFMAKQSMEYIRVALAIKREMRESHGE